MDQSAADRTRSTVVGTVLATAAAACFSVTILIQRTLAEDGLDVRMALGVRFGIATLLLLAVLVATGRPLVPARGERVAAAGLGLVGYATEAGLFYLALGHGSAGAVSLLFYAYPALVVIAEVVLGRTRMSRRTVAALAASSLGALAVVGAGEQLDIDGTGVLFALAAAGTFAAYFVTSAATLRRTAPMTAAAWVAGGASLALLTLGAASGAVEVPRDALVRLLLNGLATAAAFTMLYAALGRLGASRTGVVMTFEALLTVLLGWLVLDEAVVGLQLIGGAGVLTGAVLVATGARTRVDVSPPGGPAP